LTISFCQLPSVCINTIKLSFALFKKKRCNLLQNYSWIIFCVLLVKTKKTNQFYCNWRKKCSAYPLGFLSKMRLYSLLLSISILIYLTFLWVLKITFHNFLHFLYFIRSPRFVKRHQFWSFSRLVDFLSLHVRNCGQTSVFSIVRI
jgi:hypothetical protein